MWILGISRSHNGAIALIHKGKVISAIQAERISRVKRQSINLRNDEVLVSKCVQYCLNQAGIKYRDINSIAINTPWDIDKLNDDELFSIIGGKPSNYEKTYYIPHHYAHVEYILHYSNLSPGIVLIVDGSGTKEKDRKNFDVSESIDSKCILNVSEDGKETVSAYYFDGKNLQLIYTCIYFKNDNNSFQFKKS